MNELCLLLGAAIIILSAFVGTRLGEGWRRRNCPYCGTPMRRRPIMDAHVWVCGVCGRVRAEGSGG